MDLSSRPNEQWWTQEGQNWFDECQRRRNSVPYYMLQEVFLASYFTHAAPCKVLEFGCGFGRHLSYLRQIPGLDIHGCDISPTMLASARHLIDDEQWLTEHVTTVPARGRLPYPDKSFDIVYTASVLIHVKPEDVPGIVSELIRVAKRQIFHIENLQTDNTVITCAEHNGCWAHPLRRIYADFGVELKLLPSHGSLQDGYLATLDAAASAPQIGCFAGKLVETEKIFNSQAEQLRAELATLGNALKKSQEAWQAEHDLLQAATTELTKDKARISAQLEALSLSTKTAETRLRQLLALQREFDNQVSAESDFLRTLLPRSVKEA